METTKYLSSGDMLGGHYEIVDVLGDNAFEIVYLVKDSHLGGKFFVLKELFLEGVSYRDEKGNLCSVPKTEDIFNKIKKEFIETFKKDTHNGIEVYGYFEEHNTIYTIMEFLNTTHIDSYLKDKPKSIESEEIETREIKDEPVRYEEVDNDIEEEDEIEEKKSKKSPIFLIGLIFLLLIFMGLAYYAFKIIEEDKAKVRNRESTTTVEVISATPRPIHHPPLVDREKNKTEHVAVTISENKPSNPDLSINNSNIEDINETNTTQVNVVNSSNNNIAYIPDNMDEKVKENTPTPNLNGVPKAEIYNEEEISLDIPSEIEEKPLPELTHETTIPQTPLPQRTSSPVVSHTEGSFSETLVSNFLTRYVNALSHGSVDTILSLYDRRVQKYFNLTRVTHKEIRRDKEKYNAYWAYRDFKVENFKILKTYSENGVEYSDISVHIKWSVSTKGYTKSDMGGRVGSMTLKKTPNGVKIKAIY